MAKPEIINDIENLQTDAADITNNAVKKSASTGTTVNFIWSGTQAQYDAIGTKDPNTVYIII